MVKKVNTLFSLFLLIIIKSINTQGILTNIIRIGELDFRYVNFASFSNGDMIVQTTAYPGKTNRLFYAMKSDGRGFFNSGPGNENRYHYSIEAKNQERCENFRYESMSFITTMNQGPEKGKEYLTCVGRYNQYTEVFDFTANKMHQKSTSSLLGNTIKSLRGAFTNVQINGNHYIILGFKEDDNLFFKRLFFKKKNLQMIIQK